MRGSPETQSPRPAPEHEHLLQQTARNGTFTDFYTGPCWTNSLHVHAASRTTNPRTTRTRCCYSSRFAGPREQHMADDYTYQTSRARWNVAEHCPETVSDCGLFLVHCLISGTRRVAALFFDKRAQTRTSDGVRDRYSSYSLSRSAPVTEK